MEILGLTTAEIDANTVIVRSVMHLILHAICTTPGVKTLKKNDFGTTYDKVR